MAVLGATSLTGCNSIPDFIASGSLMLFQQSAAPTSWTKDTTSHNNKALRVVTGTASPGGTTAFTTVFASRTPTGTINQITATATVGNTTLTTAQIPSHAHGAGGPLQGAAQGPAGVRDATLGTGAPDTSSTGGGGAHNHPVTVDQHNHTYTGTAQDFAVQYVDVIIASKN
jgi:hypothetical protein